MRRARRASDEHASSIEQEHRASNMRKASAEQPEVPRPVDNTYAEMPDGAGTADTAQESAYDTYEMPSGGKATTTPVDDGGWRASRD